MSAVTNSSLNAHIQTALSDVQQNFLDAAIDGPDALSEFHSSWMDLRQRIEVLQKSSSLDATTLHLAAAVAQDIAVMASHFLEFQETTSSLGAELIAELDKEMGRFQNVSSKNSLLDSTLPASCRQPKPSLQNSRHPTTAITSVIAPIFSSRTPSITESMRSASDPNPLPEFIEHAYKFFVANIFNPYPTRAEKQAIVAETNNERVTLASITNWFANARRRCGWTTILKERCAGNREQLVMLATRVFVDPDPENPVDPKVSKELTEMKVAVETMYERKSRTSAWIEDLENLENLLQSSSDASTGKQHESTEDHRRAQETQKKREEFERRKHKVQTEGLRKAEKVTKMIQREQEKQMRKEQRAASFAVSEQPQEAWDEEITDAIPIAGTKRSFTNDDDEVYRFPDLQQFSPLSSRSSSFISDNSSSESRVPSLTWSDSGDERPYKRSRTSLVTPPPSSYSSSPRLSPALEIPACVDSEGAILDSSALVTMFSFSVNPRETLMERGKKRCHDQAEVDDPTPHAKRRRHSQPIIASASPNVALFPASSSPPSSPPAPTTPLFTPRPSFDATPTQPPRKGSFQLPSLDEVLGLDLTQPPPVQIAPPDASLPLDVDVFKWPSDSFGDSGAGDAQDDFSQLLQLFSSDTYQPADDILSFDLSSLTPLPLGVGSQHTEHSTLTEDLSGLMSGLMSDEALQDMGMDLAGSLGVTPIVSRDSSVAPMASYDALTTSSQSPISSTVTTIVSDKVDKTLERELKRKELVEKRAALERESERLFALRAELERELEDS